ncbi:survival motor neuron protein 1-like [Ostrea edulis]|uniref:survival motor neuron protein 1-like n=1 Tax=Ostrea edulis TaxID=37623 RepID=UPI0024AE93D2|nr:survival motor neuron protein 1-like [Ostrea edulis]
MAAEGTLLFQRGQQGSDSENDLWDDTALIKAYDNAISLVKAHIKKENGLTDEEKPGTTDKKRKSGKRKKRHRKKKQWRPGDQCRATFSEDGLVYDAEILSVDQQTGTCVVRYRGYGNEEEQILDNLKPAPGRRPRQQRLSDMEGGSMADSMDWCGQRSDSSSKAPGTSHQTHTSTHRSGFPWPSMPPMPNFSFPPQFPFPGMPSFSNFTKPLPQQSNIPFMPPPPPPVDDDVMDGDNEAMCSMLMAWYMSGYHTGYYQGMKQARQHYHGGTSPHPDSLR